MTFARGGVQAIEAGAHRARAFAFDDVPETIRPHVSRVRSAAIAASRSYSTDDRELAALLILPFLILASAMVIGQSVRRWENFEVPVAYERPGFETQKTARARAIAAEPMIALAPATAPQATSPVTSLSDLGLTPIDRFVPGIAKMVDGGRAIVALQGLPDRLPQAAASGTVVEPEAAPREQLAMLGPDLYRSEADKVGAASLHDLGPGRAIAPPSLTELPALDDDGSLDGAKHMCLAAPPKEARVAATPAPQMFGRMLAEAALEQTESFVIYNDAYRSISYPGGDVPDMFGVCTDVIVRAYRALGIDLQRAVHEAKVGSGDVNIDHRRVEVLRRFFAKVGESLPVTDVAEDYQPGDIVSYYRPQNQHTRSHIAIVSSVVAPSGRYMIIHNRGWGPQLEDGLFVDQITGHFRYSGQPLTVAADPLAKGQRSTQVTPASLTAPAASAKPARSKASAAAAN